MPIYEFECEECKKTFDVVESISAYDPKTVACPKCGSKKVRRRYSRIHAVTSKKS